MISSWGPRVNLRWVGTIGTIALLSMAAIGPVLAQRSKSEPMEQAPTSVLRISADEALPVTRRTTLGLNKAMMIELPVDAQDAIISQPNIIDASVLTARRVLVYAKAMGDANVFLLGRDGRKLLILDLSVKQDLADLHGMLQKLLPGSKIKLTASGEGVVLSGSVAHGVDAARAEEIANQYMKGGKVVNLITAGAKEQVMLKITVAELQREAIRRIGMISRKSLPKRVLSLSPRWCRMDFRSARLLRCRLHSGELDYRRSSTRVLRCRRPVPGTAIVSQQ